MKFRNNYPLSRTENCRGFTLIELSVIIATLLLFLSFLFPAAGAWKRGTNRAQCILNIRQIQLGVRSFSNMHGLDHGSDVSLLSPPMVLENEVVGSGKYIETPPICPEGGSYIYAGNVIPPTGTLFMGCSLAASQDHEPKEFDGW